MTSIGDGAFWECTGLTEINIPASVTSIGRFTFFGCTGLTRVTIPARFKEQIEDIFPDCPNLKPENIIFTEDSEE